MSTVTSANPTTGTAPASHDLDMSDTGLVLTFDHAFAMSAAIIGVIRDLSPDERTETIADMTFFASFARVPVHAAKALKAFWSTIGEVFALEADHPDIEQGDEVWHDIQHLERRAAINLSAAGIRDIHLPGCATFLVH